MKINGFYSPAVVGVPANNFQQIIIFQKDNFIFINAFKINAWQLHCNLAASPEKYKWSSANFYETVVKEFKFLMHFNG